jgi:DNA invertase Pin-like site-specific DNA recombinase
MPVLGKREWKRLIKEFGTDQAIADHFGVTRQTVFLNRKKVLSGSTEKSVAVDTKTSSETVQEPKSPKGKKKARKGAALKVVAASLTVQEPKSPKGKKKAVPKASSAPALKSSLGKPVDKVIALFKKGKKPKEIAELVGLSGSYVYNILTKNLGSVKNQ